MVFRDIKKYKKQCSRETSKENRYIAGHGDYVGPREVEEHIGGGPKWNDMSLRSMYEHIF